MTMNLIPNLPPNWNPSVALDEIRDVLERGGDVRDVALTGLMLTSRLIEQHRTNSGPVLNPLAIFAPDLTPRQRMGVRMDETVTRIKSNVNTNDGADARLDLASDLLLDYITRQREGLA